MYTQQSPTFKTGSGNQIFGCKHKFMIFCAVYTISSSYKSKNTYFKSTKRGRYNNLYVGSTYTKNFEYKQKDTQLNR